jgi:carboxypeptidase C (cathepsin A)
MTAFFRWSAAMNELVIAGCLVYKSDSPGRPGVNAATGKMKMRKIRFAYLLALPAALLLFAGSASAQYRRERPQPNDFFRYNYKEKLPKGAPAAVVPPAPEMVVTHHQITLHGKTLAYTAYTGMMPIRNVTTGVTEGQMFYVYYAKDGVSDIAHRPLFFVFNGGPGSASIWLHIGGLGPIKVALEPNGLAPAPPYRWETNPSTLLDDADMVFIDAIGTGFSRPMKPEWGPKFWGVSNDNASIAEFIRLFLVRYNRWDSPKFVCGESYGTTRAADLSGYLTSQGIALNGVVLLSTIINPDGRAGDLHYVAYLPTMAMTAWYHHKLAPDLEKLKPAEMAKKAQQFASTEYLEALYEGDRLPAAQRQKVIADMARLTGLSPTFIADNDLRVSLWRFSTELLRSQHLMTGRLDSRFTAFETDAGSNQTAFDASDANISNAFPPAFEDYLRTHLGYKTDRLYYVLGGGIGPWSGSYKTVPSLEEAFAKNPNMHLFVGMGYYDFATVYYAVDWTLAHLKVSPQVREHNIMTDYYDTGHMIYIDAKASEQLHTDLAKFITASVPSR